jgi:hypothetical protein
VRRVRFKKGSTAQVMVHCDPASQTALADIQTALIKRWNLDNRPSISLMLQGVILAFAERVKQEPEAINVLLDEIKSRSIAGRVAAVAP